MALARLQLLKSLPLNPLVAVAAKKYLSDKVLFIERDPIDAIDDFTSVLVQQKVTKWIDIANMVATCRSIETTKAHSSYTTDLNAKNVSSKFVHALTNEHDLKELIEACVSFGLCPNEEVLRWSFECLARNQNVDAINSLRELVGDVRPNVYVLNSTFGHYLGQALWAQGDVIRALELFDRVYRERAWLRRKVNFMFGYLVLDVTKKSEATLVNIVRYCEALLADFGDCFPMVCLWQMCFLSEWFDDQRLSTELLGKHERLRGAIVRVVPHVVGVSLRNHQTEAVYRLLEVLLSYNMKAQYSFALIGLFNYKCRLRDLKSCSEIIKWSLDNGVTLPASLHKRYLMLLLNTTDVGETLEPQQRAKYQLQF